jgi:hypothetical protein
MFVETPTMRFLVSMRTSPSLSSVYLRIGGCRTTSFAKESDDFGHPAATLSLPKPLRLAFSSSFLLRGFSFVSQSPNCDIPRALSPDAVHVALTIYRQESRAAALLRSIPRGIAGQADASSEFPILR